MILRLFFMLFLTLWSAVCWAGMPRFVPITEREAGIGEWRDVPFGQMRVLSCSTGVKDLAMVVGGLQVRLKPGWGMKRPALKPLSDKFPSWIEVPLVLGNGQTAVYQKDFLFPLIYMRDPKEKGTFDFGVQGEFPVCEEDKCMNLPIRIVLPLSAEEADYTSVCTYLVEQQREVPLPGNVLGIHGRAWTEGGHVWMAFEGIKGADIAFLQNLEQKSFHVLETRLEKMGVLMRVDTKSWERGQKQEWIVVSDRGIFKVPVKMGVGPVNLPKAPISWKIWFLGWELFFLTPLLIVWGISVKKTVKTWRRTLLQFILLFPIVFVIKALLVPVVPFDTTYYAIAILALACLLPPQTSWGGVILFLLWPYFPELPELSIELFALWLFVMWVETMLPFVFLYFSVEDVQAVLYKMKQKSFFLFNLVFLLPTVILLGQNVWHISQKASYADALNPDGLSVVCAPRKCRDWQKMPNVRLIAEKSVLGKTLQKMYNRSVVVIWQKEGESFILPPDFSVKKAKEFIENWQNYRAVHKP